MTAVSDRTSRELAAGSALAPLRDAAGRRVVLERAHYGLDTSSPAITRATVERMGQAIQQAISDPLVRHVATRATAAAQTPADALAALWWWVKHSVKFQHHDQQICELLDQCQGQDWQLIIAPAVLLRMKRPAGDCCVFTTLIDALAAVCGFEVRIVTLACDRRRPGEYTHVYGAARLPDVQLWCPLDASHGLYPGWEVPASDVQRRTEWSLDARMLADESFDPLPAGFGDTSSSQPAASEPPLATYRDQFYDVLGVPVPVKVLEGSYLAKIPNWAVIAASVAVVGLAGLFVFGKAVRG